MSKNKIRSLKPPVTVAVVGAGVVGKEMIQILEERNFPLKELRVLARSARTMELNGKKYQVRETNKDAFEGVDIALFAGTEGEKGAAVTFGKDALSHGAIVIDNGSDYRMNPKVPLVIPEINAHDIRWHQGIIANPNCTTAVLLMAVAPIYKKFGVKRIIVSTYQAVSGAGAKAVTEMKNQTSEFLESGEVKDSGSFPDPIAFNVLAHGWKSEKDGYCNEEVKVIRETHKILGDKKIEVIPTTVRVPVVTGHAESVYIETKKKVTPAQIRKVISQFPGVKVMDENQPLDGKVCPVPWSAQGKDDVYVGRIRKDLNNSKAILLWAVGDNLRKGAALNAVQIAESVLKLNGR